MEKWILIKELGIQLSSFGNIKKFNKRANQYVLRKPSYCVRGYERIVIKGKNYKVHRLVAFYFISSDISKYHINHIDFDKKNNKVSNLEIVTCKENIHHYQKGKVKKKSSSKHIGVGFHIGIQKWTTRVTYNKKRYSVGVFSTEKEAIERCELFNKTQDISMFSIGKGVNNKSKYTECQDIAALILASKIGVRKAGVETKMGSTRIYKLRREYKLVDGQFVKDN